MVQSLQIICPPGTSNPRVGLVEFLGLDGILPVLCLAILFFHLVDKPGYTIGLISGYGIGGDGCFLPHLDVLRSIPGWEYLLTCNDLVSGLHSHGNLLAHPLWMAVISLGNLPLMFLSPMPFYLV